MFMLRVYKLLLNDIAQDNNISNIPSASTAVGYFLNKEFVTHSYIKKTNTKVVFSTACVALILLFNISANVSIWPNIKGLTREDKQNSITFRNARGGNCINEFTVLKPVLEAAPKYKYISEDIINILGKPDAVLNNGTVYRYSLFPSSNGCVGIVAFSDGIVAKCSIENCK